MLFHKIRQRQRSAVAPFERAFGGLDDVALLRGGGEKLLPAAMRRHGLMEPSDGYRRG